MWILTTEDKMLMLISATRTLVFLKISAVSKILGLKTAVHMHSSELKAKMDETMGKGCTRSFGFHWAASILLKCYVLLHYFERARATKGGFWSQASMKRHNRPSTVPRFCLGKTEVCCVLGFGWQPEMPSSKVV